MNNGNHLYVYQLFLIANIWETVTQTLLWKHSCKCLFSEQLMSWLVVRNSCGKNTSTSFIFHRKWSIFWGSFIVLSNTSSILAYSMNYGKKFHRRHYKKSMSCSRIGIVSEHYLSVSRKLLSSCQINQYHKLICLLMYMRMCVRGYMYVCICICVCVCVCLFICVLEEV